MKNGGTLICGGKFRFIDDYGVLQKAIPGCSLNSILGCRFMDVAYDNLDFELQWNKEDLKIDGFHERSYLKIGNVQSDEAVCRRIRFITIIAKELYSGEVYSVDAGDNALKLNVSVGRKDVKIFKITF